MTKRQRKYSIAIPCGCWFCNKCYGIVRWEKKHLLEALKGKKYLTTEMVRKEGYFCRCKDKQVNQNDKTTTERPR